MRDQAKKIKSSEYIASAALLGLGSFVCMKDASVTGDCGRHDITAMHVQDLGHFSRVHFVLQVKYSEAVLFAPQWLYFFFLPLLKAE